jgi:hypothetical protein
MQCKLRALYQTWQRLQWFWPTNHAFSACHAWGRVTVLYEHHMRWCALWLASLEVATLVYSVCAADGIVCRFSAMMYNKRRLLSAVCRTRKPSGVLWRQLCHMTAVFCQFGPYPKTCKHMPEMMFQTRQLPLGVLASWMICWAVKSLDVDKCLWHDKKQMICCLGYALQCAGVLLRCGGTTRPTQSGQSPPKV